VVCDAKKYYVTVFYAHAYCRPQVRVLSMLYSVHWLPDSRRGCRGPHKLSCSANLTLDQLASQECLVKSIGPPRDQVTMVREVFVATSSTDPTIAVVDPRSASQLAAYKNNLSGPGGVANIQSRNSRGAPANGFLVGSQMGKQALHFWCFPYGRDALHLK
jgi:hypothetical protein